MVCDAVLFLTKMFFLKIKIFNGLLFLFCSIANKQMGSHDGKRQPSHTDIKDVNLLECYSYLPNWNIALMSIDAIAGNSWKSYTY